MPEGPTSAAGATAALSQASTPVGTPAAAPVSTAADVAPPAALPSLRPAVETSADRGEASLLLVALHGWLLSGRLWDPLVPRLPDQLSFWAPDLPGFGQANRPHGLLPSLAS